MKEIVILSGKGGTGKTSLTASFACLADSVVLADCDVDAADLHLVVKPSIEHKSPFVAGNEAIIDSELCSGCDLCKQYCRFNAIVCDDETGQYRVDSTACEGCGVCVYFCPDRCIDFPQRDCGEWFQSETRFGPMVHARLNVGAENTGKLVSLVRTEARKLADKWGVEWLIVDGAPGIGCPVIASMTGVDHVLLITEPTQSGKHDIERVLKLAKHFDLPVSICVNKWDINPAVTEEIERLAMSFDACVLGRVRYDHIVNEAQIAQKSVIEMGETPVSNEIRNIWSNLLKATSY